MTRVQKDRWMTRDRKCSIRMAKVGRIWRSCGNSRLYEWFAKVDMQVFDLDIDLHTDCWVDSKYTIRIQHGSTMERWFEGGLTMLSSWRRWQSLIILQSFYQTNSIMSLFRIHALTWPLPFDIAAAEVLSCVPIAVGDRGNFRRILLDLQLSMVAMSVQEHFNMEETRTAQWQLNSIVKTLIQLEMCRLLFNRRSSRGESRAIGRMALRLWNSSQWSYWCWLLPRKRKSEWLQHCSLQKNILFVATSWSILHQLCVHLTVAEDDFDMEEIRSQDSLHQKKRDLATLAAHLPAKSRIQDGS